MRKLQTTIVMTAVFLAFNLLDPQINWGATYWASPAGSGSATCSSISGASDPGRYGSFVRAVACATAAGDIVKVKPGTYTSSATIVNPSSGVTIQGSSSSPSSWPVLRPTGTSVRGVNFNNTTRSGIVFKYLRWDMSSATSAQSCIGSSSDAKVSFTLEDFECLGPSVGRADSTASGIRISQQIRATIRRGVIRRWHAATAQPGAHALYWSGSNGVVEDTQISDVNGYCLQWYSSSGVLIQGNIYRENNCSNTKKGGVYIQSNSRSIQVHDSWFCNVAAAITDKTGGSGTTIYDNIISCSSAPSAPNNLTATIH